jgi:hypothetical protein
MSYFVFRQQSSTGARELADALGGRRLRRFENGRFFSSQARPNPITVRPADVLVMWGAYLTGLPQGVKVLNNAPVRNKFDDAKLIAQAGVPTIEVAKQRPRAAAAQEIVDPAIAIHQQLSEMLEDLVEAPFTRNDLYVRGVNDAATKLAAFQQALRNPAPVARAAQPAGDWVGRMNNHVGGNDLLQVPGNPDFFVKKLDITEEYRIHMFGGRSIRAGIKKHREGFANPSPWIRSYEGGWRIVYDGFKSKEAMRAIAANAVKALGLDFGAVDIGKLRNGNLVVLEVNRAPGLEGGTVDAYSKAITEWSAGNFAIKNRAA